MNIVLIEPFFSGSHKQWALGYKKYSKYNIEILSLKGIFWKWRMHGGALTLSKMFNEYLKKNKKPDLILVTDMLNLPLFTSFANVENIPIVTFFHENQITYPWSTQDRDKEKNRDHHYGFINYTTALRSDLVMFNSYFHKNIFITELKKFLKKFPDNKNLENVDLIEQKSKVTYLGLDLSKFDEHQSDSINNTPIILWNHRWEYDKNPEDFFDCLKKLKKQNIKFKLIILGEEFQTEMNTFTKARDYFSNEIIHMGYSNSFEEYARLLHKSDILPVTTKQEFFGISVIEAIYCNVFPLLPRRLTYPELFNDKINHKNFYDNNSELFEKLKTALINKEKISLKSISKRYDWNTISNNYDKIFEEYARLLHKSDILPVTTKQEFFGISVIEAIYCNVFPLLPRRLTYPELFNDKINHKNFYDNNSELFEKLKKAILNVEKISLKSISKKYDWNIISNSYDKIFKDLKRTI